MWICANPRGHLQATGKDARGRKQYRYHPAWVAERDSNKFDSLADFAQVLPRIRRAVVRDLRRPALCKERVLAAVVRLMDRAFIRVGGERYRRENGSFGATTLRNRHVRKAGDAVVLDFRGKSGKHHTIQHRRRPRRARDPPLPRPAGRRAVPVPGRQARRARSPRPTSTRISRRSPAPTSRARTSARGAARCARPVILARAERAEGKTATFARTFARRSRPRRRRSATRPPCAARATSIRACSSASRAGVVAEAAAAAGTCAPTSAWRSRCSRARLPSVGATACAFAQAGARRARRSPPDDQFTVRPASYSATAMKTAPTAERNQRKAPHRRKRVDFGGVLRIASAGSAREASYRRESASSARTRTRSGTSCPRA